jgi:hypothetical protein
MKIVGIYEARKHEDNIGFSSQGKQVLEVIRNSNEKRGIGLVVRGYFFLF